MSTYSTWRTASPTPTRRPISWCCCGGSLACGRMIRERQLRRWPTLAHRRLRLRKIRQMLRRLPQRLTRARKTVNCELRTAYCCLNVAACHAALLEIALVVLLGAPECLRRLDLGHDLLWLEEP